MVLVVLAKIVLWLVAQLSRVMVKNKKSTKGKSLLLVARWEQALGGWAVMQSKCMGLGLTHKSRCWGIIVVDDRSKSSSSSIAKRCASLPLYPSQPSLASASAQLIYYN